MTSHKELEFSEPEVIESEADQDQPEDAQPDPVVPQDLEYRVELTQSLSVADFTNKVLAVVRSWGFSDYSLYRLPNKVPVCKSMITTMRELQEIYDEGQHAKHDLVLMHAQSKSVPTYLSLIDEFISTAPFDNELFARNRELVRLYRCFGFSDLYCIPVNTHDGNGRAALMVLAEGVGRQEFKVLVEKKKTELRSLAIAIDYIGSNKFPDYFRPSDDTTVVSLSPRPLELLNTLAKENIPLKHAAERMFISLDTANKHIAAVKKALGATTQASAVYLAIRKGLIELQD